MVEQAVWARMAHSQRWRLAMAKRAEGVADRALSCRASWEDRWRKKTGTLCCHIMGGRIRYHSSSQSMIDI
jgi:hypothetical protein